ncbi:glycoside hydrolase family 2 protein [Pedobacter frigiditerrae]|uniref:Glycoside hydrolase family 2 protein n=1 Tax=Pedobacter frigiditerrae TaxID=2530452 RepID=A0A4R0MWK7_9SPHI|nr:sugar-binding domain-containing protein [Pedobacter frigiditerrae]TCC91641.1 glycoside hydrolase family 2 protein [Pedobacter frigiditerrae]
MKHKLLMLFCLIVIGSQISFAQNQRSTYNFNPGWKLYIGDAKDAEQTAFDDRDWKSITLPYAWNEDEAFKKSIEDLSTGIAWYRKHFILPSGAEAKKIFLEFEGIRQGGEFYLNGKFIGRHENGITSFGFDISSLVEANKDNVLAVRIDNSWTYREKERNSTYQWNDKNFNANYGGISKNVRLHITGKLYQTLPLNSTLKTTGNYIYAKDFNITGKSAVVVSESQIKNETADAALVQYDVEIKDADGKIVKTYSSPAQTVAAGNMTILRAESLVNGLNFWSWGYGYLYTITSRLKVNGITVDELNTKTGFRKAEFKNGMVYLNDRVLMMKGYAQRTSNEWPAVGLSVPAWLSDYSNGLMVESNANLVRWMHITPWKQDIESCDRVGLIQAMPAGDSEKDVTGTRWDQREEVMTDAIIYNRNNPSILFYECGNESISAEHMVEMKAIKNQYDPNGGRAIGSREMLNIDEAEYGGEMLYINKSATKPLWSMEYSRDEGLRKYWDEFSPPFHIDGAGPKYKDADASDYNRNQDSHAIENVKRWNEYYQERPGTGTRVSSGGVNIIFSDSNTHHRGEENYRRSGEVDAMRIPKDGFYAHKVMWDGWVDAKKTGIHLVGHWNYKAGTKKNIYVVAAGDKAELILNGKSLGFGEKSNGFLYTFKNIAYQAGTLKAVSYDNKGLKLSETQLKTAGEPVAIKLTKMQNPTGFKADGADLALVQVEVVDAAGNRCPIALNMIKFDVTGPAEWRGGIAQGPDNYILSKQLPVEGGVNRILVRSTTTAGKINITATAEGLKPGSIALETLPVMVKNGLSSQFPADGLKSSLKRGATPAAQTYQVSRKAIKIVGATAGANSDKAKLSYDDNELSDWVNDGILNTAWIKYDLEKESTIGQVELKVNGFRTKAYPIRILVDGKEVFKGNTVPSLGYFTAICKPTKGKTVTIQLLGSGKEAADNAKIGVEVNGKKLDDGIERVETKSRGGLSIIETEIYEAK